MPSFTFIHEKDAHTLQALKAPYRSSLRAYTSCCIELSHVVTHVVRVGVYKVGIRFLIRLHLTDTHADT